MRNLRKIKIFYFSGTGNTKLISELFSENFTKLGHSISIVPIELILKKEKRLNINEVDLVGFGFPVHAFSAPAIFINFLRILPNVNDIPTFLFKTSGDPLLFGGATSSMRKLLNRRKFKVFHETLIVMPANILMSYDDRLIKQLYDFAKVKVEGAVNEILQEKWSLQPNPLYLRILSNLFSAFESMGGSYFGRYLITSVKCNLCGKCVRICPAQNITILNDHVIFGNDCSFCLRCVYSCPESAISNKYMDFLILKRGYDIKPVINNDQISANYLTKETKGYFKHFYRYIIKG